MNIHFEGYLKTRKLDLGITYKDMKDKWSNGNGCNEAKHACNPRIMELKADQWEITHISKLDRKEEQ